LLKVDKANSQLTEEEKHITIKKVEKTVIEERLCLLIIIMRTILTGGMTVNGN